LIDLIASPGVPQTVAPQASDRRWSAATAHSSGDVADLREDVRQLIGSGWVEEIEIRADDPAQIQAAIESGRLAGRRVRVVGPVLQVEPSPAAEGERWIRDHDAWVLIPPERSSLKLAVKRLLDVVVAGTLLVVLSPIFLFVAIALKLVSPGPVFYLWRVLGESGRPFDGFKFRTMVPDADDLKPGLQHLNERQGPVFKIAKDPRVTPLGRWLRRHSVDELPQLWNVLIGDMSLVGPRPVFHSEYRNFELWQMRKMSVKPGLTCLWQVHGRHTITDFADWARLDLKYIDTWSLLNDLAILFRTPIAVIKGTGH
jgi:lipopolysaccharide/colanic/teichoic acid biosynthesis glycosyltransferase